MSQAMNDERLNDYVDGLLSPAEAAEVEQWLTVSAEARDTVEFLRSLRERAAKLPRAITPEHDLWAGIRDRMAPAPLASVEGSSGEKISTGVPVRRLWPSLEPFQWAALATAATVLVVLSSTITAWLMVTPPTEVGSSISPGAAPSTEVALEQPAGDAADYAIEIEQLLWLLYENREALDPDTATTIETNLRVIDRAIRSAREALENDPQNDDLTRLLASNYRHKLQLLQRASRIIELS